MDSGKYIQRILRHELFVNNGHSIDVSPKVSHHPMNFSSFPIQLMVKRRQYRTQKSKTYQEQWCAKSSETCQCEVFWSWKFISEWQTNRGLVLHSFSNLNLISHRNKIRPIDWQRGAANKTEGKCRWIPNFSQTGLSDKRYWLTDVQWHSSSGLSKTCLKMELRFATIVSKF